MYYWWSAHCRLISTSAHGNGLVKYGTNWSVCLFSGVTDSNSESAKDISIDVAGLHLLLSDSLFAKEFVPMVSQTIRGQAVAWLIPFVFAKQTTVPCFEYLGFGEEAQILT